MRLDKYLSKCGLGSRNTTRMIIKSGKVSVNSKPIKKIGHQVNEDTDSVVYNDLELSYREFVYLMLNKPKDYVTANKDNLHDTVFDLISGYDLYDLHSIGRLDIDTEGLIILTNDGDLTHKLISPKQHVAKEYHVSSKKTLSEDLVEIFKDGIVFRDGYKCLPAIIKILGENNAVVTIFEGKFHQIKKMFFATDNEVVSLKRLSINGLTLDEKLKPGDFRELTNDELIKLKS